MVVHTIKILAPEGYCWDCKDALDNKDDEFYSQQGRRNYRVSLCGVCYLRRRGKDAG